jgi:hypothetical protein
VTKKVVGVFVRFRAPLHPMNSDSRTDRTGNDGSANGHSWKLSPQTIVKSQGSLIEGLRLGCPFGGTCRLSLRDPMGTAMF